jgi:RNA recognition motif-containing protein
MNIYVGNLSYDVSEENLRQAFESFGQVISAKII